MADLLSDVATEHAPAAPDDTKRTVGDGEPGPQSKPDQVRALDKLYSDLGGPAAVGRIIGVSTEHAAAMKRRGSIPIEHWPALIMSPAGKALGLTEGRLLFVHTGVIVDDSGRSLVPVHAPPKEDDDPEAKVRWTSEDPDLLFNMQPATRVYRNNYGQVVICQEAREYGDDDPYVFIETTNIPKLIAALQREAKGG